MLRFLCVVPERTVARQVRVLFRVLTTAEWHAMINNVVLKTACEDCVARIIAHQNHKPADPRANNGRVGPARTGRCPLEMGMHAQMSRAIKTR